MISFAKLEYDLGRRLTKEEVAALAYAADWRTIANILRASPVSEGGTWIEGWAWQDYARGWCFGEVDPNPVLGIPSQSAILIIHLAASDGGQ